MVNRNGAFQRFAKRTRKYLYKLQAGKCFYCNCYVEDNEATLEHLYPIAKGGASRSLFNVVMACNPCNNKRKNNEYWWNWKLNRADIGRSKGII